MKMVMISTDDYEKLSNAKKEAEAKMESYKQCVAGYESRIKELTEELEDSVNEITNLNDLIGSLKSDRTAKNETIKKLEKELDELKSKHSAAIAKKVLNSVYGTEQGICCRILNGLNKSMFDKITELSDENERLAAENQCLTNNPETTKLSNELNALKKQYRDLNNAYKSQKNTLYKLTKSSDDTIDVLRSEYICLYKDYERVKLAREEAIKEIKSLNTRLSQVATKVAKIYNNTKVDTYTLDTLVEDLKAYI